MVYVDPMPDLIVGELEAQIRAAREEYYNLIPGFDPSLSDAEFDALVDRLRALDPESTELSAVGAPIKESLWAKVTHTYPMGSLDKVNTPEELSDWVKAKGTGSSPNLLVLDKLDGISIQLVYQQGALVGAATRGDGLVGENILPNVLRMKGVPQSLPCLEDVTVRGEIVLHKDDLKQHFPDQSNTRNTAAGTAKRSDGKGCEHLTIYCYQAPSRSFRFEDDVLRWLKDQGFKVPVWNKVRPAKVEGLWTAYQKGFRDELAYDIDGLVVRILDIEHQESLGEHNHRPKGATAFKFPSEEVQTRAVGLEVQVGGAGHLTPVGVVDPVTLVGAEVRRASLYNWDYIKQIGFHVGAEVCITRANDVIPRITRVVGKTASSTPPVTECPECQSPVEWEGKYLVCPNTAECPAQIEGRLGQWVKSLGILEWGDSLIEKVVASGLATTVPDLYRLSEAQLAGLDRMGPASAKNARDQLWSVVPMSLARLVGSLGIPLCATSTLETVVGAGFDTLEALQGASETRLQAIPGMGPKRAKALHGWLQRNEAFLAELQAVGVEVGASVQGALTGKSFCFTGTMQNKRSVLEKMVIDAGGSVASVKAGLSFLVLADSTTTKAEKARKKGISCITEEQFLAMVGT